MRDTLIRSATHTARKNHECSICAKVIKVGTVYERNIGIFDGLFQSYASHKQCIQNRVEYIRDLKRKEGCGEWAMGV